MKIRLKNEDIDGEKFKNENIRFKSEKPEICVLICKTGLYIEKYFPLTLPF